MEFTHRTYEKGQTIAAIGTPPGEGGIAIIRISGEKALSVADQIFSGSIFSYKTHTVHFGKILDIKKNVIDEGLVIVMRAPHSYTGENTVEIHCHGGVFISQRVLKAALQAGARVALPGEFTFKAFQNGKIDLTRAEAIQKLIAAKNSQAAQIANTQLQGHLFDTIQSLQKKLIDGAAILEAWVDFPEEGLEFITPFEFIDLLDKIIHEMTLLKKTFYEGKRFQTTHSLCLLGAPNVGKSSLMNLLAQNERAIVTPIAGTTRDILEEEIFLADLNFRLIDTAGIRKTDEMIEKEGIKRSLAAAEEADLILYVLDVTAPKINENLTSQISHKHTIAIWNKIDVISSNNLPLLPFETVFISAKEKKGIETLKEAIYQLMWRQGLPSKEEVILSSERHYQALDQAIQSTKKVIYGLKNELSPEFLTADMKEAIEELGTIIGINVTEEVLSAIFSKFCVGK